MSTLKKLPVGLQSFPELIEEDYILGYPNREIREALLIDLGLLPSVMSEKN